MWKGLFVERLVGKLEMFGNILMVLFGSKKEPYHHHRATHLQNIHFLDTIASAIPAYRPLPITLHCGRLEGNQSKNMSMETGPSSRSARTTAKPSTKLIRFPIRLVDLT